MTVESVLARIHLDPPNEAVALTLSADCNEMRQKVADHLEANAALYCDFLCQPVPSENDYNADTEQPTAKDEYIDSVRDPHLQTELRWQKYVRCLRQGAWGDHITMQAIANIIPCFQ